MFLVELGMVEGSGWMLGRESGILAWVAGDTLARLWRYEERQTRTLSWLNGMLAKRRAALAAHYELYERARHATHAQRATCHRKRPSSVTRTSLPPCLHGKSTVANYMNDAPR